jgi:hypothetical protein
MNILEAVANWHGCPYGLKNCRNDCENYMIIDPITESGKGIGPSTKGQRTLCSLLEDLNEQVMKKTNDSRLAM